MNALIDLFISCYFSHYRANLFQNQINQHRSLSKRGRCLPEIGNYLMVDSQDNIFFSFFIFTLFSTNSASQKCIFCHPFTAYKHHFHSFIHLLTIISTILIVSLQCCLAVFQVYCHHLIIIISNYCITLLALFD